MLWVAALLLGLIALFSVPVDLVFRVRRESPLEANISVRWMFGLLRFRVRRPAKKRRPITKPEKPKKRARARRVMRLAAKALRTAAFRRRLLQFLIQILGAVRMRDFALRLRMGLDDPADTGFLWAFLGPLIAFIQARRNAKVDVAPHFAGETLEFDTRGDIRIIPAQMVWIAAAFALSPVTLSTAWAQRPRA